MARKSKSKKRPARRRRSVVRTVTRWRTRAAKASRRGRRRSSGGGSGLLFREGRTVVDTVKNNLPTVAGLAVATTVGAMGAGYAARKLAPRLRNNPMVGGVVVTVLALLVGAAARKLAGKAGGAVGPRSVAFAALGAATYGLSTVANAARGKLFAPRSTSTSASLPAGGPGATAPRSSAEAIAQLA